MKAIVLAAGLGSRLNPLTTIRPKHLLPIAGRPILEYVVTSLRDAGVSHIGVIVHYLKDKIFSLLGHGEKYGVTIEYIEQGKPRGTAHAVMAAEKFVGEEACVVVYGDITVKDEVVREALRLHREKRVAITMVGVEVDDPWNYGVLSIDEDGFLTRVVEKPKRGEEPSKLINGGVYIMEGSKVFPEIRKTPISPRGELEFTDTIQRLVELNERVAVLKTSRDWWFDIGRPWDLLDANAKLLKERVEEVETGGGVRIGRDVRIIPPVTIGDNCVVKDGCILGPNTSLGSGVEIGAHSLIENSIILSDTVIGGGCKILDSIIGEECVIESGVEFRNRNPDGSTINMTIKDVRVDSGRRRLGSIVGDYSFIGCESIILPGVSIYPRSIVPRNSLVVGDVRFTPSS